MNIFKKSIRACAAVLSFCVLFSMFGAVSTPAAKISKSQVSMQVGSTTTLTVSGIKREITWKSSDRSIARVDSRGVITAVKSGTCEVTAQSGKKRLKCNVSVTIPEPTKEDTKYIELSNNIPNFTAAEKVLTKTFETYSKLDSLGRCGVAYANICKELMPTEERGSIGYVKPSGWETIKYPGIVDGNYLYNRCHLIAFCLAGENANSKNLITGTRYFNVEGMLPFEDKVYDYMKANPDNHVLYRVTPHFDGNNLVASGVQMEAYSVEDSGKLSFHVFVFNLQPGIEIDYATGKSHESGATVVDNGGKDSPSDTTPAKDNSTKPVADDSTKPVTDDSTKPVTDGSTKTSVFYVLNQSSKKFHSPGCRSVSTILDKNRVDICGLESAKEQLRAGLIADGYSPCKICNP